VLGLVDGREGVPTLGREGVPTLGREGVLGRVLGRLGVVEGREGALGRVPTLGRVPALGRLIEDEGRDDERLKEERPEDRLMDGLRLIDERETPPPRPPPPRPPPPGPRAKVSPAAYMRTTAMAIRESRVTFMVSPLFLSCLLFG
jgi:hypothetical protein